MKGGSFIRRMGYAVAGWRCVWRNERSFRAEAEAQAGAGVGAGLMCFAAPSPEWIAIIILTTGVVLALQCLNAAIEYLADTLHPALSPGIGAAKDAAAGAVLIASLAAIGIAATMAYSVLS
jgi:diacylglycerol kinase (ATP)